MRKRIQLVVVALTSALLFVCTLAVIRGTTPLARAQGPTSVWGDWVDISLPPGQPREITIRRNGQDLGSGEIPTLTFSLQDCDPGQAITLTAVAYPAYRGDGWTEQLRFDHHFDISSVTTDASGQGTIVWQPDPANNPDHISAVYHLELSGCIMLGGVPVQARDDDLLVLEEQWDVVVLPGPDALFDTVRVHYFSLPEYRFVNDIPPLNQQADHWVSHYLLDAITQTMVAEMSLGFASLPAGFDPDEFDGDGVLDVVLMPYAVGANNKLYDRKWPPLQIHAREANSDLQELIGMSPNSPNYGTLDNTRNGVTEIFAHEFYHLLQSTRGASPAAPPAGTSQHWLSPVIEGQAAMAPSLVLEGMANPPNPSPNPEHNMSNSGYMRRARSFLLNFLNMPYHHIADTEGYSYALYWRFLYEHYRDGGDPERMAAILQSLDALAAVRDEPNPARLIYNLMDPILYMGGGRYESFDQAIAGFALANYILSDNDPQVQPFTITAISRYDFPVYTYKDAYARAQILPEVDRGPDGNGYNYGTRAASFPNPSLPITGVITSTYGMDFIEVDIDPFQDNTWLQVEFDGSQTPGDWFQVQVVTEYSTTNQTELVDLDVMNDLWDTSWNHGLSVLPLESQPPSYLNKLAFIITRHDFSEGVGTGAYTLTLTNPDDLPPYVSIQGVGQSGPMTIRSDSVDQDVGISPNFPHESGLAQHEWINYDQAGSAGTPTVTPLDTKPGQHDDRYLFTLATGQQATVVVTATDKAGNLGHAGAQGTAGSGQFQNWPPGGDHPDDNYSAASAAPAAQPPVGLWPPAGARPLPAVALFAPGFTFDAEAFLHLAGEPVTRVTSDFSPGIVERYPVLVIPSGGLYGFQDSPLLQARLAAYVETGGALLVFAQQRGEHYAPLPGGQVGGYGWRQDTSCFDASLLLETYHPALSGFDRATLTAHVDGYFTRYPEDSTVLLSRSQNGLPGALMYPYGQGRVIVTSMYDDWGASRGQSSPDARTFVRDLLSWAVEPADDLPTYAPGQALSLSVPVANDTRRAAAAVRLSLVDPARTIVQQQVVSTTLAPGAETDLAFSASAAPQIETGSAAGHAPIDLKLVNSLVFTQLIFKNINY